jgi:hypothetical protein
MRLRKDVWQCYGRNESNFTFQTYTSLVVGFWTILRIMSISLLWVNLWVGYLVNLLLDAVDGDLFARIGVGRTWYQHWDKLIDLFFYVGLLVYAHGYFTQTFWLTYLTYTFVYRFIGLVLFFITRQEWLLMLFVNIFTEMFLILALFPGLVKVNDTFLTYTIIISSLLFGLLKEWWIHVARVDVTAKIFNIKRKW